MPGARFSRTRCPTIPKRHEQNPTKFSPETALDRHALMYHIYDYAPQPKRIGTGAQKYRRAKGKRSFHEGYRQPNM